MSTPCPSDLNNLAVAQLQAEKPQEAIQMLRIALSDVKNEFKRQKSAEPFSYGTTKEIGYGSEDDTYCQDSFSSLSSQDDSSSWNLDSDEHEEYDMGIEAQVPSLHGIPVPSDNARRRIFEQSIVTLFDRAFCVDNEAQVSEELLGSVVLYNMALVNHLRGIDCGASSFLATALALYQMSLDLLLDSKSLPVDTHVLMMAIHNNSAHIHAHNQCIPQALNSLDEMNLLLEDDQVANSIDEEDFSLFYLNAMVFLGELAVTAAPAA